MLSAKKVIEEWMMGIGNDDDERIVDEVFSCSSVPILDSSRGIKKRGGSRRGKSRNIDRDFDFYHQKLWNEYFAPNAKFSEKYFRRRFRMSKHLFLRIVERIEANDSYFTRRPDALGKLGASALQKCV
eukprot:TRINITY_DN7206_c0_g2_i1.p1 TRINITY_DN7206_c0_g2~~TRINITY_DN7206_c0_g2_i1.p1  ORF type:complete len:128 (-),score=23.91 TRINITY_DN7206_c0_g2_i1:34-417(-)